MTFSGLPLSVRRIVLPGTSDQSAMPFELRAGSLASGELKVREVAGRERMSECFRFDVDVASTIDPLTVRESVLGQPATLIMRAPSGASRFVRGITASLRERGPLLHHHRRFELRIVPTLWLLRRRRNSRIFQDQSVVEIVTAVLRDGAISHRWATQRAYAPRKYCVQYRETDYEFVTRLLREEGIFYFFDSPHDDALAQPGSALDAAVAFIAGDAPASGPNARESVVFADVHQGYPAIAPEAVPSEPSIAGAVEAVAAQVIAAAAPVRAAKSPTLAYRPTDGVIDDTDVTAFELERTVRSKRVTLKDYDFERPLLDTTVSASSPTPDTHGAEYDTAAVFDPAGFEIYEHHGDYVASRVQQRSATSRLEGYRGATFVGEGASACQRLAVAHRFTLDDHPDPRFNREYSVTELTHTGHVPQNLADDPRAAAVLERPIYANRFKCIESTVPARPMPRRRRTQQVVEVATVVGPAGEEIHTDSFGRIKVQFPWDREGKRNEKSSCWMRVTQPWAGAGWGAQFIPRIGMEVVVTFLDGDLDRPIVIGCLGNALHPTPFELPLDKSRSGWRTQSTPGGEGFNELSFEDSAGAEQVYLHAARDLDETVGRNHTLDVAQDEVTVVAGNQSDTVGGNRERVTAGSEDVLVGVDQSLHVKGDRSDTVDGDLDREVGQDETSRVGGSARREVAAGAQSLYGDDVMVNVRGSYTTLVGRPMAKRAFVVHVEGAAQVEGTTAVDVSSDTTITLRCGPSVLRLTPTGIEINAPAVHLIGGNSSASLGDTLDLTTTGASTLEADTVLLLSDGASVALNENAAIDGTKVLLKSPPNPVSFPAATPVPPTCIELTDQTGKPIPNQRYVVTYEDGTVLGGLTDSAGKATLLLDQSGTISFPDVADAKSG